MGTLSTHQHRYPATGTDAALGRAPGREKPAPGNRTSRRRTRALVIAVALLSVGWLILIFLVDNARFVVVAPRAKTGFEVLLAVGQLFGALVLGIFPNPRFRWASLGLSLLGIGTLGFGYLYPLAVSASSLETTIYGSWFVRTISLALIALSLWPAHPPACSRDRATSVLITFLAAGILLATAGTYLPSLIKVDSVEALTSGSQSYLHGLTAWHWILAPVPLVLGLIATAGSLRHFPGEALGGWLVAAIALATGAQLHSIFWPSLYSSVVTSASFLRLAFTLVLVTGGILELRVLLSQRDALLAEEQERLRRMEELARMKDDFTAIVAHELASPVGAVGALTDVLALPDLTPEQRAGMTAAVQAEVRMLHTLVSDVQAVSAIDRDDFPVSLQEIPLGDLLRDATTYASTLDPCRIETDIHDPETRVHADPERIGQVLRNLLTNACKHTPSGTTITLRAGVAPDHVRIEVEDNGPGIPSEEQERIFDKYARGQDRERRRIRGRGLGLYVSRRIVRLHGSDLRLVSEPGRGTCFSFDLEVVR